MSSAYAMKWTGKSKESRSKSSTKMFHKKGESTPPLRAAKKNRFREGCILNREDGRSVG